MAWTQGSLFRTWRLCVTSPLLLFSFSQVVWPRTLLVSLWGSMFKLNKFLCYFIMFFKLVPLYILDSLLFWVQMCTPLATSRIHSPLLSCLFCLFISFSLNKVDCILQYHLQFNHYFSGLEPFQIFASHPSSLLYRQD